MVLGTSKESGTGNFHRKVEGVSLALSLSRSLARGGGIYNFSVYDLSLGAANPYYNIIVFSALVLRSHSSLSSYTRHST